MYDLMEILSVKTGRIAYKGQPVITFRMIDELHQRPEGTARNAFNRNRKRFEEGYHYFEVPYQEWSKIPGFRRYAKQRNPIKLFTKAGYLLLIKPFQDDLAWFIQGWLAWDFVRLKESN